VKRLLNHLSIPRDPDQVFAVEASEGKLAVWIGLFFGLRSPPLPDQFFESGVDRLRAHILAEHAAAIQPGTVVAEVPPGDTHDGGMSETDGVELRGVVGLSRLVPLAFDMAAGNGLAARGRRELGNVEFLAKRGVPVEDLLDLIKLKTHGARLVGLDADAVEGHTVLDGFLEQLEEGWVPVGHHIEVVDNEVGFGVGLPRPAIGLVDLHAAAMGRFVDDFPEVDFPAEALYNLGDALLLHLGRRLLIVCPRRSAGFMVPQKGMALHSDLVLVTPGNHLVGVGVVGFPGLGLVAAPVEAERRRVEEVTEPTLVGFVSFSRLVTVELVDVAAEQEVVADQFYGNANACYRTIVLVHHPYRGLALSILLNGLFRYSKSSLLCFHTERLKRES